MLALESVPDRLGTAPRSGVFDTDGVLVVETSAGVRTDPTEEREFREAADPIASGCLGDQGLLGGAEEGERVCSFDADLRNCWD